MLDISIKEASIEELQAEINRREEDKKVCPSPLADDQIKSNMFGLKESIIEEVEEHFKGNDDEDTAHYLWEAALEAVYGPSIWLWWNK